MLADKNDLKTKNKRPFWQRHSVAKRVIQCALFYTMIAAVFTVAALAITPLAIGLAGLISTGTLDTFVLAGELIASFWETPVIITAAAAAIGGFFGSIYGYVTESRKQRQQSEEVSKDIAQPVVISTSGKSDTETHKPAARSINHSWPKMSARQFDTNLFAKTSDVKTVAEAERLTPVFTR